MTGFPTTYDIHVIQASLHSGIPTDITCNHSPDTILVKGDDLPLLQHALKGSACEAHHANCTFLLYLFVAIKWQELVSYRP